MKKELKIGEFDAKKHVSLITAYESIEDKAIKDSIDIAVISSLLSEENRQKVLDYAKSLKEKNN